MPDALPVSADPSLPQLRIFVSSPGDVDTERKIAERVIARLAGEFGSRLTLAAYFWEAEPMRQQATFQDQIPATADFDVVLCILWSRLGTPLTGPDGKQYPSGTDYEVETARAAFAQTGRPDLMLYLNQTPAQVRQIPREEREKMMRQLEALEDFVARHCVDAETSVIRGAFTSYRDLGQFEDLLEKHLRKLIAARLPADEPRSGNLLRAAATWQDRPYRGLSAFDFEHAPIFFGRTRATGEVLTLLHQRAVRLEEARAAAVAGLDDQIDPAAATFVLVCAMSGVGKSSLVRAGVLPLLAQAGGGVGLWRRVVLKPGETPAGSDLFDALAQALTKPDGLPELLGRGGTSVSAAQLAFELRRHPAGADALVGKGLTVAAESAFADEQGRLRDEARRSREAGRVHDVERLEARLAALAPPAARLAVVIDQMEELFTLDQVTPEVRRKFVQALAALARHGWVYVIGTLRSDFFARCSEVPELMDLQQNGIYHLKPPAPEELGQMIRRPAQAAGLAFERHPDTEADLDEVLRDLAARSPEALPLLEFALDGLYERRDARGRLTWAAYEAIGGLEGALAAAAEEALGKLRPWQQETFDHVMGGLVTLGTGTGEQTAHRRTADYAALTAPAGARAFVDAFIAARLFVADQDTAGRAIVSVAHEALLARRNPAASATVQDLAPKGGEAARPWLWARLGEWVEANADFLRMRARVAAGLKQWQDASGDAGFLLPAGRPLLEGEALLRDHPQALSTEERDYIARSMAAEAGKRRQRARVRTAVMAGLALLAAGAGVGAWFGFQGEAAAQARKADADRSKAVAESEAARANLQAFEARKQTGIAEQEAAKFQAQLRQASLADVATAKSLVAEGHWREAIAYLGRAYTYDAANERAGLWLWDELVYGKGDPLPRRVLPIKAGVQSLACSRDGRRFLTVNNDGKLRQWDIGTFQPLGEPIGGEHPFVAASYSPDGKRIAAVCGDESGPSGWGYFQQYDAAGGRPIGGRIRTDHFLGGVSYSPDGAYLLSPKCGNRHWDANTGKPAGKMPKSDDPSSRNSAFSPDGKRIAAIFEGEIEQWDANTGKTVGKKIHLEHWNAESISYSPDGAYLMTGYNPFKGSSGQIERWDLNTGEPYWRPILMSSGVDFAEYSPDGCRIIALCGDGLVRQWKAEKVTIGDGSDKLIGQPLYADGQIRSVTYSGDGSRIMGVCHSAGEPDRVVEWEAGNMDHSAEPEGSVAANKGFSGAPLVASPDGQRVLVADAADENRGGGMWISDANGKVLVSPFAGEHRVLYACFGAEGKTVLATCADQTIRRWDAATGKELGEPIRCATKVRRIACTRDGRRIAVTCEVENKPGWIEQRDAASGQVVGAPLNNGDTPLCLDYSPDGSRLLVGYTRTQDETRWNSLLQWDLATGKAVGGPIRTDDEISQVAYNRDGGRFLAQNSSTVTQYDSETGERLGEPLGDPDEGSSGAAYRPDGAWVRTMYHSSLSLWEFDPPRQPPPAWFERFTQVVSGYRFGPGGDLVALTVGERLALRGPLRDEIEKVPSGPDARWLNLARWCLSPIRERRWTPGSAKTVRDLAEASVQTDAGGVSAYEVIPDLPLVHLVLAAGDNDNSFPHLDFLVRYDLDRLPPDNAALWSRAAVLLGNIANSAIEEDQPKFREKAIQAARRAITIDPKSHQAKKVLIECLGNSKLLPEQLAAYDDLLALPEATGGDYKGAGRLAGILGRGDRAREIFRRAAEKFPTESEIHVVEGWTLIDLKAPAEALAAFDRHRQTLPLGGKPHNDTVAGTAVCRWMAGDKTGAANDYQPLLTGSNAGYFGSADALKKDDYWTEAEKQLLLAVLAETLRRHPELVPK